MLHEVQQEGATYSFNLGHITCVSHAISALGRNRIDARVYVTGRSDPFDLILTADQFNELARAWALATGGAPMSDDEQQPPS
jgi:hypothetical protein